MDRTGDDFDTALVTDEAIAAIVHKPESTDKISLSIVLENLNHYLVYPRKISIHRSRSAAVPVIASF